MMEGASVTTIVTRKDADLKGIVDVFMLKKRKMIKARRKFRLKKNRNIEK